MTKPKSLTIHLLAVAFLSCVLGLFLMYHTFGASSQSLYIASTVYSDFAAHLPLIRSFSLGSNFPPEYPTFPGEPIRYHFSFYALIGLLERLGIRIDHALNIPSVFGFSLLALALFATTYIISSSLKAAWVSLTLLLFNGSANLLIYFQEVGLSLKSIANIISLKRFVSFGPWNGDPVSAFWHLNIYTNQRHTALGYALFLLLLLPFHYYLAKQKSCSHKLLLPLALGGLALGLLHHAASLAVIIYLVALISLSKLPRNLLISAAVLITSLIVGLLPALSQAGSNLAWQPGFLANSLSITSIAKYLFLNFGLHVPIFLALLIHKILTRDSLVPVMLASVTLFTLAFLFRFSPDMINNHKLINLSMFLFYVFISQFLIKQTSLGLGGKVVSISLLLVLTVSGVIDFIPILNDHRLTISQPSADPTQTWISQNTSPRSIFLTNYYLYNSASMTGRFTFTDYGYFNWSLGYDDQARKALLPELFSSNQLDSCTALSKSNISHVLLDPTSTSLSPLDWRQSFLNTSTPSYTAPTGHKILEVSQICPIL